ncbi:probable LRR receptor-like serine/threonine-protein kinase At1g67720 [Cryptomeria japonica]|uniref:probable LRR receptor-like serine/threonine-protein kinase At1g67720 n=1 Tax=Cryptomeria japonica TaxID=3369 RepID=UPI0027DA1F75|nr:probable LRR receptor-like serine/threonine-protein kinase At1g67720 [Cryptomeria japonica]
MNILGVFVSVSAQPGFLNIDCGGRRNSIDSDTNMNWIVDANYIDVGNTANVSMPNTPFHMQSLRFFPKPLNKSCYRLPVSPNVNYLLRLWFLFGNYKESQKLPSFNVSFETKGLTQKVQSINYAQTVQWTSEKILTSPNGILHVCLIRTAEDSDPFVSAIQLRSLVSGMYSLQVKPGIMLSGLARHDLGNNSPRRIRYPQDEFDRFWSSDGDLGLETNNLPISKRSGDFFSTKNNSRNYPPIVVLQTALIAKTETEPLVFHLEREDTKTLVVLYSAEIEVLNASEYRKFKIVINNIAVSNISLELKNNFIEVPVTYNDTGVEVIVSLETIQDEPVSALLSIKSSSGMNDWISDPCFSVAWSGIRCNRSLTVRVVEISIQDNHLSGVLPDLCNLARLEILRLQNNNFSGTIPDCLSKLKNLKELNIENNNFTGVVPEGLLSNKLLDLRYSGNPDLCKDGNQCHSKDNNTKIVVVSAIGALLGYAGLIPVMVPNPSSCRSFSLLAMKTATINFSQKIGEGGFGSVYFGRLPDGKDVAVKLLSSSKQGLAEFLNEINLLSRVHHKNLVSLIGYCNESEELMLVYEHMCGGSLKDHLYELEYLHVNCTPKIVHRDVKSSNILLDSNLRAKMADFGLSKIIGDEVISSHITTTVKGIVGYLDPEYFHTNKLTEKSDIYSFGVVLLKMICGRKAIDPELCEEELSLLKWVMVHVEVNNDTGDPLTGIIDQKLRSKRPTITEIVIQIKYAIDIIKSEYST